MKLTPDGCGPLSIYLLGLSLECHFTASPRMALLRNKELPEDLLSFVSLFGFSRLGFFVQPWLSWKDPVSYLNCSVSSPGI